MLKYCKSKTYQGWALLHLPDRATRPKLAEKVYSRALKSIRLPEHSEVCSSPSSLPKTLKLYSVTRINWTSAELWINWTSKELYRQILECNQSFLVRFNIHPRSIDDRYSHQSVPNSLLNQQIRLKNRFSATASLLHFQIRSHIHIQLDYLMADSPLLPCFRRTTDRVGCMPRVQYQALRNKNAALKKLRHRL